MRKLAIVFSIAFIMLLILIGTVQASTSDFIVGASVDMPEGVTPNISVDSISDQATAVQSMIDTLNAGGHVVIAGGTGGAVSASMVQQVMSGVTANTGGQITIVAGLNSAETVSMMQVYQSGGTPVSTQGTGNQTPQAGATTYGYPSGFTGTTTNGYNYGQSLLDTMAPGNTTGGFLNYTFPTAPVYVAAPDPPPPPKPSIVGSVTPVSGYPGQALTLTGKLGEHTSYGYASDGFGSTITFNSSESKTYTIPTTAKIGQIIKITFYAHNSHYDKRQCNSVSVFVVNPITLSASADPTTLAPTETTAITATTTGFVNKVTASGRIINPDGYKVEEMISTGSAHTVTLKQDGTVWVMGYNSSGQLGTGDTTNKGTPTKLSITNVNAVSAGDNHTVFLKNDGTVWTTGNNSYGQLGTGDTTNKYTPTQVTGISGVVSIAGGTGFTAMVKSDGTLWTMGNNSSGQLGVGDTNSRCVPTVVSISDVKAVSAGSSHMAILKKDGTVWITGIDSVSGLLKSPKQVTGISSVSSVAAGSSCTIMLKNDGTVWAMGNNDYGQLGTGNNVSRAQPTQIANMSHVISISTTNNHSVMVKDDGTVWGTGYGQFYEIGEAGLNCIYTPIQILGVTEAKAVSIGYNFTVILKNDGTVWAMGYNSSGQLGINNGIQINSPTQVAILGSFSATASGSAHSVLLKPDGTVWTAGSNSNGQLGLGDYSNRNSFTKVDSISGVKAISAGFAHTVILKSDGTVWVMGDNTYGQLGLGDNVNRNIPTQVSTISGVKAIAAGSYHTILVRNDGTVMTMGYNSYGQLGTGDTTAKNVPTLVSTISGVMAAAGGKNHTVMLTTSGVWSMGDNSSGQLGLGNTTTKYTPTQVTSISSITAIAAGDNHTVALKSDATTWAVGNNSRGQVGINGYVNQSTFIKIQGMTGIVTDIAAGGAHTVMRKSDGSVWTVGDDSYGQLGDNSLSSRTAPVQAFSQVKAIGAGGSNTIMLFNDGSALTVGRGDSGQLGVGDTVPYKLTPTAIPGTDLFSLQIKEEPVIDPNEMVTTQSVTTGQSFTVMLKSNGTVWTMGNNTYGQLGTSDQDNRNMPTQVSDGVKAIAAGGKQTILLKSDGTVWAMGANDSGQLGNSDTSLRLTPTKITGISDIKAISTGLYHTVLLKNDGTVWVMGNNTYGQLGLGDTTKRDTPTLVPGISDVSAISCSGYYHTVLLKNDGTVWTAGYNSYGQLGTGDYSNRTSFTKIGISGVSGISAGYNHTVLLKEDGTVWAMGDNGYGDLGTGDKGVKNIPTQVANLSEVSAISAGYNYTALLKTDGTVWMTGKNDYGQLGTGYTTDVLTPTQVLTISGVSNIAAGFGHTMLVKADGTVWSMGDNTYGQLGIGSTGLTTSKNIPTQILNITKFSDVAAGKDFTLFLKADGTVWATGLNSFGQLGTGDTINRNSPTQVLGVSDVKAIATGDTFSIFLKRDGTVWGVGDNQYGQLGTGDYVTRSSPTQISGISGVSSIVTGTYSTFLLKPDGSVWAMGYNNTYGLLGTGDSAGRNTPTQLLTIGGVKAVASCYYHTVFLKTDGTVWTVGNNDHGELGMGDNYYRTTPTQVSISNVKAVAAGYYHTVLLKTDGTVWGMGSSEYYQLGVYGSAYKTPTQITGISGVGSIAAGDFHTVLLKSDGTVWSMGYNSYGQLGRGGSGDNKLYQVGITGVVAINAGYEHTAFLKTDGTVCTTGHNDRGQLGTEDTNDRRSPDEVMGPDMFFLIDKSATDIPSFDLTPADPAFPSSNTWSGTMQIPTYAPIGSQLLVTITAQSKWPYMSGYYPTTQTTIVLNIANTITIGNPTSSKTTVSPGDTITITVPTSNGYALEVTASGPNPSDSSNPIVTNLTPTTSIATIPKLNTWTGTFTIPSNAQVGSYVLTFQGFNNTFVNQSPSTPKFLNLTVGTPPVQIVGQPVAIPDPVYSHRDEQNIVTVSTVTQGLVGRVTLSVSGQTQTNGIISPYSIVLPDMLSSDNKNWTENYLVPDNIPDGTVLTFQISAVASNGAYTYGPVPVSTTVKRYLIVSGKLSSETGAPGQIISLDGSKTDGHASSLTVKDNLNNSVNLTTTDTSLPSNTWTGSYTIPTGAKIGQKITLTWTPTDIVSGTNFQGTNDQKTITVANTPQIVKTVFNQVSPYPGAETGAPTGTIDAIVLTSGWVNSLNVSWDTSYSIPATSYVEVDSNGTRQWTIKGLTVPANADVSNNIPTVLNIKAQTPFVDQVTGSYQVVTGTAILPIDNKIVTTAQQLANPVVTPGTPFTITVQTKGFATQVFAKNMNGSLLALTPSSSVSPTIPFTNTWTGSYVVPNGTPSQAYEIPVYAINNVFVNQPQSNNDYISINIGGVPAIFSASLDPYTINLPADTDTDRTVNLYAQTTGQVSGVQVSLSINGGPATLLPPGNMSITSGIVPGLVSWQGSYLVDPGTPDQTQLTFTFQAKDSTGTPAGPTITPHYVTVVQTRPPKVIITH